MLKKYLEQISKLNIHLIGAKKINSKILNKAIFGEILPDNLVVYKKEFFDRLDFKKVKLKKILENIKKDKNLTKKEKQEFENEVFVNFAKIDFLKKTYDIEANKLDKNYEIKENLDDYDYYNKIFYGVSKDDIKKYNIKSNKEYDIFISKKDLEELLSFAKSIIPELKWNFVNSRIMYHSKGYLGIPNKEKYKLRNVIVLFFHEMTHLLRYLNGIRNLGFDYIFEDYNTLEEGIAQYNEYYYGNKIMEYGEYIPYYDICYNILLNSNDEEKSKQNIFEVLKNKGFSRAKSLDYYFRFHKYTILGSKKFFLKDLVYTKAYNNVLDLLKKDSNNYKKIMSGKIGLKELDFFEKIDNINSRVFFEKILEKIKNKLNF